MKSRDTILLIAVTALCLAAGLALAIAGGGGGGAAPVPLDSGAPLAEEPSGPAPEPVTVRPEMVETVTAPDAPTPGAGAALGPAPGRGGIIDGQLLLSAGVAGTFGEYTIGLTEMVNPNADDSAAAPPTVFKTFRVVDDTSPQYFAWHDVPYSRYGYDVRAFVKGLNGSSQVVRLTEQDWNPQVRLSVSPGAVFALRLIDQDRFSWTDLAITMRPRPGQPGLTQFDGVTDNFGSVVFENVLAGDYEILVDNQPRAGVTVAPPGFVRDDAEVGVQSALITIPRGQTFTVEVFGVSWAIPDAQLVLFRVDTTDNVRFEKRSDQNGVCVFEHVPPGRYHLQVRAERHQPTDRALRIDAERGTEPFVVRLARIR